MTREELLEVCRKAPTMGEVALEDFVDYILVLPRTQQVGEEWVTVEGLYMAVDGKIAMANLDHRLAGKRLDFEPPMVLVDDEEQLTLMVTVTSEIYGRRHGIATSHKVGGSLIEQSNPWEVAETSAIGRALAAMGYGLLPGASLTSAEDVAPNPVAERGGEGRRAPASRRLRMRRGSVSEHQQRKLAELYREVRGVDGEALVLEGLDKLFEAAFGHGLEEASYREGSQIIAQLMAEQRAARRSAA